MKTPCLRRIVESLCWVMVIAGPAGAQSYPVKPVRVIVPFPPAGAADIVARVITQEMSKAWGAQVIVDNRAGAGGLVGAEQAARAAPDGYTLLFASASPMTVSPHLTAKPPYHPLKDFTPIIDTVAGHCSVFISAYPTVAGQMRVGRLRAIAVTSAKRLDLAPELPTVAETLSGFEAMQWWGAYGPLGLPAELVAKLNADIGRALLSAEVKQRLAADAAEPAGGSPRDLAAYLKTDYERWGRLVKSSGIRAD